MEREFRAFLREKLSKEMVSEFKEFMQQVHLCLKLINKCPDKDLLENEVREKVEELIPQVKFDQLYIDRAAQLYHL